MRKTLHIIGSAARTLLALTFLFSGFVKAVDPLGTVYKIEDYLTAFGGFFLSWLPLATVAAVLLILTEWTLGVLMLCNVWTKVTSWLSLLFYIVMTPLTLYIALTNPVSDCGCFGDALVLTNWQTFWKNIILTALVITLLCTKKHIPQTFVWQAETGIFLLAMAVAGGLMMYTHYHLPVIDFRPYKIGNNIPELMEFPEDAEHDVYDITYIYEKDGVQQQFTLANYPKGDSTWHFVDQNSKLIKKGYEPPIHDFELIDYDGEDITFDLLEAQRAVLVVMYDLAKADVNQLPKVAALGKAAEQKEEAFFILTAATDDQIDNFIEANRFDVDRSRFLTADGIMLKTIVRANPGVFVIENGTITDKYNIRNR